ncbi:hypothetical protein AMTR_s00064p00193560 [Amborella trichopoda]|uniref:Peptidase M16 C-terminal domain-containing protein n=1 Tax=Amborella trichopoda TaxID=13333 RepID=U5DH98_AMBTC|nr:hypothetical protein AMTR_s00064p00193560 [Amborella trichopoda]
MCCTWPHRLSVFFATEPDRLDDLSNLMMQEFCRLAYRVSEDELIRARNQLKSALMLHIDGSSSIAENNGRQLLTYGRIVPFVELFARIDAVDADAVKQAAHDFIIDKDVAIAALGPIQRLPSYNRFRSQTCTL